MHGDAMHFSTTGLGVACDAPVKGKRGAPRKKAGDGDPVLAAVDYLEEADFCGRRMSMSARKAALAWLRGVRLGAVLAAQVRQRERDSRPDLDHELRFELDRLIKRVEARE